MLQKRYKKLKSALGYLSVGCLICRAIQLNTMKDCFPQLNTYSFGLGLMIYSGHTVAKRLDIATNSKEEDIEQD